MAKRVLTWNRQTQHYLVVPHGGRTLFVGFAGKRGGWTVTVVEAPRGASPGEALADHGHAALGTWPSMAEAKRVSEKFARSWLAKMRKTGVGLPAPCDCRDIS